MTERITYLSLVFEVDSDSGLSHEDLYNLGDRIVAGIVPDPPVITLWEIRVETATTA